MSLPMMTIINDFLSMFSRPTINQFLTVKPKTTIDDFLLYLLVWLIALVGHFFWYFIWCGFQSKKDFVFHSILISIFYIIGVLFIISD